MSYDFPDKEETIDHIKLLPRGDFLHGMVKKELEEKMDNNIIWPFQTNYGN